MTPRASEVTTEGIDSFQLPKALVTRIAKSVLPPEAKLQKDTVNTLVDSATVFINYLAATAHDVAVSRSRKTIAAPDILKAMEIIGLEDLVSLLESELEVFKGGVKSSKSKEKSVGTTLKRGKVKGKEASHATKGTALNQEEHDVDQDLVQNQRKQENDRMEDEEEEEEEEEEQEEEEEEQEEAEEEEEEEEAEEEAETDHAVETMALEEDKLLKDSKGLEEAEVILST